MKRYVMIALVAFLFLGGCAKPADKPEDDSPSKVSILDKTLADIKVAYGDDYGPNTEITKDQLQEVYNIDMENVSYFVAEGPMMTNNTDMFIGLIANPGKIEDVKKDVLAYQQYLINDSFQYPMNMARVQASEVVIKDNVIFFVVLGKMDDRNDVTEEQALEFAKEQVKIAIDVINGEFN